MLNHDAVSDFQVVAPEKGPSSGFTIPSWMTVQNVFSKLELIYSRLPSCLELTKVRFLSSELTVVLSAAQIRQHGQC